MKAMQGVFMKVDKLGAMRKCKLNVNRVCTEESVPA